MNHPLFTLCKKPALWQRSTAPFWDDEHISAQMLQAHLNPGIDAASRKEETIARTVSWLCQVLPAGASVLDLGCGPGLYTKRLAAAGFCMTGMDYSRRSIAYAQAHDPASAYIYQNYLELDMDAQFDAATLIYCDYAALTESERKTLLANVRRALKPDGCLILDVFTPQHRAATAGTTSWELAENGGFWSAAPYLCLSAVYPYENNVFCDHHVVITEHGATQHIVWDTCYTKQALAAELAAAGFVAAGWYLDTCGSPYSEAGETLCCIARCTKP